MVFSKDSGLKKDCGKAAKTLKAFLAKGQIPKDVIENAKGLAIFTGFRAGMYFAGAGGSGVIVARLPDGSWSPPSAFSVRSGGIGLVYGVDMYDCVCVLNTQAAVEAYTKPELELGGVLALAAGPVGGTANIKQLKPVWTYTKSRGLYGGLTVDGTVIKEKSVVNADFYGTTITAAKILRGEVQEQAEANKWPVGAKQLVEILKFADGADADERIVGAVEGDEDAE